MKILAISGSARRSSTNTALLRALQSIAPNEISMDVFEGIGRLPVFSPDLEGENLPCPVHDFLQRIVESDGVLISSPEYVRGIPGGLKNAIDWLVSGDQIIGMPIALVHASHRGADMLSALRLVLSTVSTNFTEAHFFQLPVMKETPDAIAARLALPSNREIAESFLLDFAAFCRDSRRSAHAAMQFGGI